MHGHSVTDAVSLRSVHPHDSSLEMMADRYNRLVDNSVDRHDIPKMAAAVAVADKYDFPAMNRDDSLMFVAVASVVVAAAVVGKYNFSAMNSLMFAVAADTVELFRACF